MISFDHDFPKVIYAERVRQAEEDHLAARVARVNRQREHRALLHFGISWLRALAAAGVRVGGLRRRPA